MTDKAIQEPEDQIFSRRAKTDVFLAMIRAQTSTTRWITFSPVSRVGFYLLLCLALLWPRYFYLALPGFPGISPFIIAAYLAILLLLPYTLIKDRAYRSLGETVRSSYLPWVVFVAFVLWRLLTSLLGPPLAGEIPILNFLRQFPPLAVFFILSATFMRDPDLRRTAFRIILVAILFIAFAGFVEILSDTRLLPLFGLDRFAAGGVFVNEFTNNFYRDNSLRAQSIFTQPLVLGQFAGAAAPFCLALVRHESWPWRAVAMAAFAACLYCVWISTARSGVLVLIVSMMTFGVLSLINRWRYRWLMLIVALVILVIVAVNAYQLGDLLAAVIGKSADNLNSANARETMLEMSLSRAATSPIIGFGDGTARWLAGVMVERGDFATIDSLYLSILVQNGYPGLMLWIGFMVVTLVIAVNNALEAVSEAVRAINCAIAGIVAGMGVGLSVLSIEDNMSFVYLMAGVVVVDRLTRRTVPSRIG